jgi:NAD(P)-dependent dehydrogenase (short-subunit alcohol dehydrogenase family)
MTKGVARVTGAAGGMGAACASALKATGFVVIGTDVAAAPVDRAVPGVKMVMGDITDLRAHDAIMSAVKATGGPLTCLVNCAGVSMKKRGDVLDIAPDEFDRVMGINLRATFFLTQRVAKEMAAAGKSDYFRSITTISSINADVASLNRAPYCLSKSALPMLTRLFALRLAEHGVRVYDVRPGIIRTPMTAGVAATYDALFAEGGVPIARWGEPEDIASGVTILASGAMPYATGSSIVLDGGLSIPRF